LIELNLIPIGYSDSASQYFADSNVSASGTIDMKNPAMAYIVYIYILAFCKLLVGTYWAYLLIFVNACAQTITTTMSLWLSAKLARGAVPIFAVFGLLLFGFDFYQWISMTQSTAIFLSFATAVFLLSFHAWNSADPPSSRRWWMAAILLAVFCNFVRPSAPPIIAMVILAWLICELARPQGRDAIQVFRRCFVALAILIGLGILLHGYLMSDPLNVPAGTLRDTLLYFRDSQALGWIVWLRPDTYVVPPVTAMEFTLASLWRGAYFFFFINEGFSFRHNAFNIAYFVPLYGLSAIGVVATFRRAEGISEESRIAGRLAILLIVLIATFVSVTYLDYDWRYRAPTLPAFMALAVVGANQILIWRDHFRSHGNA